MKSVIVGTAGHIDHGKTALVRALTGIDADRLEEEKRRGITIDIGFAHLELPSPSGEPIRLGFVDVPGHERFVRNMLAGVGGIDLVLLVIAADESIKPQTREHFDICRLLNIQRGITVLTKSDMVDRDTLEVVKLEVEDFLRGSFLDTSRAPMIPVSSLTGVGLNELKTALVRVASEVPARDSMAMFRLPIDRVFTMKGFGTIVTGTLLSGSIKKEEEVEVFPSRNRARVRGVQVHNKPAEQAAAGQRTALNLVGVSNEDLARGMQLAPPNMLRSISRADVSLALLPNARALRDRTRVHLHVHTAETIAEILLYAPTQSAQAARLELRPGQVDFAQIRLAEPLLMLPGDRFIIRQFSPVVTIGGGIVLDTTPPARRPRGEQVGTHRAFLDTMAYGSPREILAARISRHGKSRLTLADAVAETGWLRAQIEPLIQTLTNAKEIVRIADVLIATGAFDAAKAEAVSALKAFHDANPLVAGISKEELRERLGLGAAVFGGALDALTREKKIEVAGEQVRAAGRGVVMKDEEAESQRQIESAFASAGLKVPSLKEVLAGLKVDRVRAQKIVTLLLRDRVLVKISEDLVFHRDALEQVRKLIAGYKTRSAKIDVARFKDLTGVSRKYAIPLLEWLDRERITKRVGDGRVIL